MERKTRAYLIIGLVVTAVALVILWRFSIKGLELHPVRIGFNTWVGYGPLYIAQTKGFFEKRGVSVSLQRIEGTGDRRAALVGGRLEGGGSTIDDLIVGVSEGVPIKMVLALDESSGADGILVSEGISTVKDLKGRTVAVQPGFVNHFFLLYVLDRNGLSSKDIAIKPLEPEAASAAFVARQVDAAVTWEPHLSKVREERPDGKLLLSSKDYPGTIVDILVFRDDFVNSEPRKVKAIVEAWYDALDYLRIQPVDARAVIAAAMELKPEEVSGMLGGVKFLGRTENLGYFNTQSKQNVYEIARIAQRLWLNEGYIKQPQDPSSAILAQFIGGKGEN
jgi:NitT/TauT family transport system substrate-binding protein